MKLTRFLIAGLMGILSLGGARAARADEAKFDLQRFRPAMGIDDILAIESPRTAASLQWAFQAYGNYAHNPLRIDYDLLHRTRIVEKQLGFDLGASLGLFDFAELSVMVPVTGNLGLVNTANPAVIGLDHLSSSMKLTSVRVTPKVHLVQGGGFDIGIGVPLEVPLNAGSFIEPTSFTVNPRLLLGFDSIGPVRLMGNLGVLFRKKQTFAQYHSFEPGLPTGSGFDDYRTGLTTGNAFTYGAGASLPLVDRSHKLELLATIDGEAGIDSDNTRNAMPLEALGAVRWTMPFGLGLTVGGGAGLSRGYGSPDYRLLAGLSFGAGAPEPKPLSQPVAQKPEPTPEPLPSAPEPAPQPLTAANHSAQVTQNGSVLIPVLDKVEGAAPGELTLVQAVGSQLGTTEIEGNQVRYVPRPGATGPDLFSYKITDAAGHTSIGSVQVDVVPAPEAPRATLEGEKIRIREPIYFANNRDRILPKSYPLLQSVAKVLADNPQVKRIQIEGYTDSVGTPAKNLTLSKRRAASVARYLVSQGISSDRIQSAGFGQENPIASNKTVSGRAANRRVEFHVME